MSDDAKPSPESFTTSRKWSVGFDVVLRTVVVLAVIVMVNYLAGKKFARHSFTDSARAELFPRTRSLLRTLTNEVNVTIYYNKNDTYYSHVEGVLREYQSANPKVHVRTVDYLRDTLEAQRIKSEYKLPDATGDNDKNLVIFDCEGRLKIIPGSAIAERSYVPLSNTNANEPQFELKTIASRAEMFFSGALLTVMTPRQLKAYALQGHGEHLLDSTDEVSGYANFRSVLAQSSVQVETLSLVGTNDIPQDCNLLIIAGPSGVYPSWEVERIQKYLDEGGRLLILLNSSPQSQRQIVLEKVLARWGIKFGNSPVRDPQNAVSERKYDVTVGAFSRHPIAAPLFGSYLNLIAPLPVSPLQMDGKAADAPQVAVLFASEKSATIAGDASVSDENIPLAVAVEKGTVKGVVTGRGSTRIVAVGDSYFLGNGWIKVQANADFPGHAVNWLFDRSQLLEGVGPRPMKEFRLALTQDQMRSIRWIILGALPGGVLLFGVLVWMKRRS